MTGGETSGRLDAFFSFFRLILHPVSSSASASDESASGTIYQWKAKGKLRSSVQVCCDNMFEYDESCDDWETR